MIKKPSITTSMKTMTGLTLIELMVTMGVLAILVAVGVPRMQGMSAGNRMSATINRLATDLAMARSEAINRNRPVTIEQVTAGNWSDGWTVVAEAYKGLTPVPLSTTGAIPNGMTLIETGGLTDIQYGGDGLSSDATARNFTLCKVGKKNRLINIGISGRYTTTLSTGAVATACL